MHVAVDGLQPRFFSLRIARLWGFRTRTSWFPKGPRNAFREPMQFSFQNANCLISMDHSFIGQVVCKVFRQSAELLGAPAAALEVESDGSRCSWSTCSGHLHRLPGTRHQDWMPDVASDADSHRRRSSQSEGSTRHLATGSAPSASPVRSAKPMSRKPPSGQDGQ